MKKSSTILGLLIGGLALLLAFTTPLHVSYYADYNTLLQEIKKHPDLEAIDSWRNDDITLEEFGFTIRSPHATAAIDLSEHGVRRPDDHADGVALATGAFQRSGNAVGRIYAHIRFDSDEWKKRGLPAVHTLADFLDHFDAIANSLITQPPAATPGFTGAPGTTIYLKRPSDSIRSGKPPELLSLRNHSGFRKLIDAIAW